MFPGRREGTRELVLLPNKHTENIAPNIPIPNFCSKGQLERGVHAQGYKCVGKYSFYGILILQHLKLNISDHERGAPQQCGFNHKFRPNTVLFKKNLL